MPRILEKGRVLRPDSVDEQLYALMHHMDELVTEGEIVGIHADISINGALLVMAAIKMGLRIAICPLREPDAVIKTWLRDLGVKTVIKPKESPLTSFKKGRRSSSLFSSILRTSGTTGYPKNAVISGTAHVASARSVNQYFCFTKGCTWALNLPLYHVSGLSVLFRALEADASIYVANTFEALMEGLKQRLITHLSVVPLQLKRLFDEKADLSCLHAIIVGGDALPEKLRKRAVFMGLPIYETYGLTETASMIWVNGQTLPHAHMMYAHDGEILVKGESLFDGYREEKGAISTPLIDGWFGTGDIFGEVNLNSKFSLVAGRKSNRIISGGENIQAEEIERVLEAHPAILESVVVGIKDEHYGMRPLAFIKWRDQPIADPALRDFLRTQLAAYKLPAIFCSWPRDTPVGIKKPRAWLWSLVKKKEGEPNSNF